MWIRQRTLGAALIAMLGFASWVGGQSAPATCADSAGRLVALARDQWKPAELQLLGYTADRFGEWQIHQRLRQAIVYLEAATLLDERNADAWHDLTVLYAAAGIDDPVRATRALSRYQQLRPRDSWPVAQWLSYVVERLNRRADREAFLQQQLPGLQRYPDVAGRAMTQLSDYAFETGDVNLARNWLARALRANRFNGDAMQRLLDLPPPSVEQPGMTTTDIAAAQRRQKHQRLAQEAYLWRGQLWRNPLDLEAAYLLIDVLEFAGFYDLAAPFYDHAERLLATAENADLLAALRRARLSGAYAAGDYAAAVTMGRAIRQEQPRDVLVGGILADALRRTGRQREADIVVAETSEHIAEQRLFAAEAAPEDVALAAWFYAFVAEDAAEALRYAERAVGDDEEPVASRRALWAWALLMNDRTEQAAAALADVDDSAVGNLVLLAHTRLAETRDRQAAAAALAETIPVTDIFLPPLRDLAERLGVSVSLFASDDERTGLRDAMRYMTQDEFPLAVLDLAFSPGDFLRCRLNLPRNMVNYGDSLAGELTLSNTSNYGIALGPGTALDPHVLVIATVTPTGGAGAPATMAVAHHYLAQKTTLERGATNRTSVVLNIGPLWERLQDRCQQTFEINFDVVMAPRRVGTGEWISDAPGLTVPTVRVTSSGFVPDARRLGFHLQRLGDGPLASIADSTCLLGGLLREAYLAHQGKLTYRPRAIDRGHIFSAIMRNLAHGDFRVRAWSAWALRGLPLNPDEDQLGRLSALLNDESWFVRLLTLPVLAHLADMDSALEWLSENDDRPLVRRQALVMLGRPWPAPPSAEVLLASSAPEPAAVVPLDPNAL